MGEPRHNDMNLINVCVIYFIHSVYTTNNDKKRILENDDLSKSKFFHKDEAPLYKNLPFQLVLHQLELPQNLSINSGS